MKKLLLLGFFLLLLALVPATEAGGPSGKATGGVNGTATLATGEVLDVSFQFNAHEKGQKGMASFTNDWGSFFHGTVDCFYQIDENTVAFSGKIKMTNDNWDFFLAYVQDNGEPGKEVDWFRVIAGSGPDNTGFTCTDHIWVQNGKVPDNAVSRWPVTGGNIQVH